MTSVVDVKGWQKRFHEAMAEKEVLLEELAPIRIRYDELRNKQILELKPLKAEIKRLYDLMAPLGTEMAILARALKSKTGKPS